MNKEFVPYEEALALKELGFDEACLGNYRLPTNRLITEWEIRNTPESCLGISSPTFSQAFKFFREKYQKNIVIFSDGFQWTFDLRWVDKSSLDKYPFVQFPKREVGREMFDTYEVTELACLKKLIEIVTKKEN